MSQEYSHFAEYHPQVNRPTVIPAQNPDETYPTVFGLAMLKNDQVWM